MAELESLEFTIKHDASTAFQDINKLSKSLETLGKSFSKLNFSELSSGFQKLHNSIASLKDADVARVEALAKAMSQLAEIKSANIGKALTPKVQKLKEETKKTTSSFDKLFLSIKRIAFYRMLRTLMKELTQAFQEGFNNMYQWSKLNDGHFSQSMDTAASAVLNIKNALAVGFYGVVEALIPLLDRLADAVINVANNISKFIAMIRGASTYTAVHRVATEYQKMSGSTGKIVKDLLKIDEINRLSDSSGSGGSSGGADYSDMFSELDTGDGNSLLTDMIFSVKDILFNWDNLTPEDIARKAVAGLITLPLAAAGFMIGGVPGALVGTLVGLTISAYVDSLTFDADGTLSESEVRSIIQACLGGLLGGAVGFLAGGGIAGALIGISVGASLALVLDNFSMREGSSVNKAKDTWMWWIHDFWTLPTNEEIKDGWERIKLEFKTSAGEVGIEWHDMWDRLDEKTSKAWGDISDYFKEKWEELKNWWKNLELPSFKIKTPHITWSSTEATGWIAKTLSALGLPTSIPKMDVQWYAKGGIVDGATLIGAGEAGKEAIIPLENNTEWIDKVAQRMAIALTTSNNSENVVKVYLDGKQISNAVTKNQSRTARAMGVY